MAGKVNLNEYIHSKMDILFLALNAPERSNKNAHWFSGNLSFWNRLFEAGIITERISDPLTGDVKIFSCTNINFNQINIGVTDLNREDVETNSSKVATSKKQVERILQILDKTSTKKLCIVHSKVARKFEKFGIVKRNFEKKGLNSYGIVGKYKSTEIYEVPFHNAGILDKASYYRLLLTKKSADNTHKAVVYPV